MGEGKYALTIPQLLQRACTESPDQEVLYDGLRRMTYGELERESEQLAAVLFAQGIRKGDRVGVSLPNWHECVIIYFAAARIGAIIVPFNPRYRLQEVEFIVGNADPKVIFVSKDFCDFLDSAAIAARTMITVRHVHGAYRYYEALLRESKNLRLKDVQLPDWSDPLAILYTSGSTGFPKGVVLSHQNICYTSTITSDGLACTPNDVFLVPVPLFHVFGLVSCLICSIVCRGRMVLMERYYANTALALIEQEKVTVHHAVPTMFILEMNDPDFDTFDLTSLRTGIIAAAPCPAETIRQIRSRMGCDICVSYGATETSAALTITGFDDDESCKSETVGRAVEGAEIKIVGMRRDELPAGEVGEIACKSPGVMIGYFNRDDQDGALDEDGWYYSGDLGTIDESGFLKVVGRKKEMIIRGGYNVYPREIEELLYRHPDILEAAVIGVPDPVMGEKTCAVIKLKDAVLFEDDIKMYLKGKLANYKVPDKIIFTDKLPMTPSGKIQKVQLKERILNELFAEEDTL
ncbi:class I adenylate-forming enzyme family protein [Paenibacillus sp. GCM10027628]|uniref:class I adenylate-forming enzyme family protein n=1 Tax=Paenibacillus sp. GCM10027628 TaxID=3273413 RepID=UPI0036356D83